MAGNNPYYIKPPVLDAKPLFEGIGSLIKETRDANKKEKLKQGLMKAYQSGDPQVVAEFMASAPESSSALSGMLEFRNEATQKNMKESLQSFLTNPTAENVAGIVESRTKFIGDQGGVSDETQAFIQEFEQDPQAAIRNAELLYSGLATPQEFKAYQTQKGIGGNEDDRVRSSEIMPNGLIIQSMDSGRRVIDSGGNVITGKEASDAIKLAAKEKVAMIQKSAAARVRGKDAVTGSIQAIDTAGKLRSNNQTLKQVIEEVRNGAETGPLVSSLPSMRAASVRLDNLQKQLGLDVVGGVTFGALSKGELDLALSKALPTDLRPDKLVEWAEDKIASQEKLADYLEDQAIYLDEDGSSQAGWLKLQRDRRDERDKLQGNQGGQLEDITTQVSTERQGELADKYLK